MELENKLVISNNELDHAKRNLIQYINSLNSLEDMIKENQSYSITENEEVQRLRLENDRLNEENSSLISSKRSMDEHYQAEIDKLKRETQGQKAEMLNMEREFDKSSLKITTVYKNLEVWREREQTIRENYDRMEQKLKLATALKKKSKDSLKSESVILTEEEISLKEEQKKVEKLLKLSQSKWNDEKGALNEEIFNLRARLNHCEEYFLEVSDKMLEDLKVFQETRVEIVDQSEKLKQRVLETENLLEKLVEEEQNRQENVNSKDQELVLALGDDIAFLKTKLSEEQDQHDSELRTFQKSYDEKLSAQSLREETLNKQIEELKLELNETEQAFESYKYLNQKEI